MNFVLSRPQGDKPDVYRELAQMAKGLLADERDPIANAANLSALIFLELPDLNWVGFYFLQGSELVLGPFQGKPACVRIPLGEGVCGTAAQRRESVLVRDVNAFPGHIACDVASKSELVVPLMANGTLLGVLDLDSPFTDRFNKEDRMGCEALAALWVEFSKGPPFV